jgi:hypothetical protein
MGEIVDMKLWLERGRDEMAARIKAEVEAINLLCDEIEATMRRLRIKSDNTKPRQRKSKQLRPPVAEDKDNEG